MEERQDLISRQAAIEAMCWACGHDCDKSKFVYNAPQDEQIILCPEHYALSTLPSAQPQDWMAQNKDRILQAGMEGREVEFRICGRLFAIREKAQ